MRPEWRTRDRLWGVMTCKRSALLIAFVLLPVALCAQDRKTALADELFTSMKMEKMMGQMKQQMPMMIQQQIQQMNLSPADKEKTDKLVQEMTAYVTDTFDWKKLRPEYVSIYADAFSEEELRGAGRFLQIACWSGIHRQDAGGDESRYADTAETDGRRDGPYAGTGETNEERQRHERG